LVVTDSPHRQELRRFIVGAVAAVSFAGALAALTACSSDERSSTLDTTIESTTAPTRASASFCAIAVDAVDGRVPFNDPSRTSGLPDDPSLNDWDRRRLTAALDDAARQVAAGGFDNTQLVDLVNELCALRLTPVTMVQ
jgi:hypothetical protein